MPAAFVALLLGAATVRADIDGFVYRDVNANGVRDAASGSVPQEPGIQGVLVQAYDASNTLVSSDFTDATGLFSLSGLGPGTFRIEVTPQIELASQVIGSLPVAPTTATGAGRVSFQPNPTFIADGLVIGLHDPLEYCQSDPTLVVNCYIEGNQLAAPGAAGDVLVSFDRTETGESTNTQSKAPEAIAQDIGTTWGLAYQRTSDTLFAASYLKRHTGFGTNNNGASNSPSGIIWSVPIPGDGVVNGGGDAPSQFVNLNTLFGSNVFGANPHPNGGNTQNDFATDTVSYSEIGKRGMGGVDISADQLTLWVVNLADRQLYEVPLGTDPTSPTAPTLSSQVTQHSMSGLFSNCTGAGDFRPFAVKVYGERVYVGAVCTGVTDGPDAGGLPDVFPRAQVFRFDPTTDSFDTTPILDFELNYLRGCLLSQGGTCFNGGNAGSTPANNTSNWRAWVDATASTWVPPNIVNHGTLGNGSREVGYPQPMLTDLAFDSQGDLLLGLRDRFGDQMGYVNNFPDADNNGASETVSGNPLGTADGVGDLLYASRDAGGTTYSVQDPGETDPEFYTVDEWNDGTYAHSETSTGGIAVHALTNEVLTTGMDPLNGTSVGDDDFSAGVRTFDADSGALLRRREVYDPDDDGALVFGKANGLGDIELLCNAAPIQVGDRVWSDINRNGVQDPGEPGLANVTVRLFQGGTQVGIVDTDVNGRFLFGGLSNLNMTGGNVVEPFTAYEIRVDEADLPVGFGVTTIDYNGNAGNGDLHDSDGVDTDTVPNSGTSVIALTTGGPGSNNQTFDVGVRNLTVDWGDLPDSYGTLASNNGANHSVVPGFQLGAAVDGEVDGQPTATGVGDDNNGATPDDEDGVTFTTPLAAGTNADLSVSASGAGVLNAWADFNGDGSFGAGEQIASNLPVVAGANVLNNVAIPSTLSTNLALRFRLTQFPADYLGGVAPDGLAISGEVEDYVLGCISGVAWDDADFDGIRDGGESLLSGVNVNLLDNGGSAVVDGDGNPITAVTNGSGAYSICGLPAATYQVNFDNPFNNRPTSQNQGGDDTVDSDPDPGTGTVTGVVVGVGTTTSNVDAGFVTTFAWVIGDTVFLDVDRDGIDDIGEPGIPNVTVILYLDQDGDNIAEPNAQLCSAIVDNTQDCVVEVTSTDSNGEYLFTGAALGTYFTGVDESTLPDDPGIPGQDLSIAPGNSNPSSLVTPTTSSFEFFDLDFGYVQSDATTALVGDLIWHDADNDGNRDPGEPGLAGVDVALISAGADGIFGTGDDVTEDTTTTANDGTYFFFNVAPGTYRVDVTDSVNATNVGSGGLLGYSGSACMATNSCPAGQDDASYALTVLGDDHYLEADFPYLATTAPVFTITDRVWFDLDSDGTDDGGTDPGIANVTVALVLDDGDGVWEPGVDSIVATDLTDANGDFGFAGVAGGSDYLLLITDTTGELVLFDPTTAAAAAEELDLGTVNANVSGTNFGYNRPGSIGDTVWIDSDGDGVVDGNEVRLGGVTVELFNDVNGNGLRDAADTSLGTTTTNGMGMYLFGGLAPGDYLVSIDTTQGALTGFTTSPGTPDAADGDIATPNSDEQGVTLVGTGSGASSSLTEDFGYQNAALPAVRGTVFMDDDRDGFQDATGEDGFPAVTVALVDSSGNVVAVTVTNSNGDYEFPDVPAGDYVVTVTDQDEILVGWELTSGLDAIPITVVASDVEDIDFGYARNPLTGSIGDQVWLDANSDGVFNGSESGINGVNVELYDVGADGAIGGGDDSLVASRVTGPDGRYLFDELPPGDYYVLFPDATAGVGNGGTALATYARTDVPGSSTSTVINLSEGQSNLTADSGWRPTPASNQLLGDTVFFDANDDGLQQAGEVGLPGVTVRVSGPGLPGGFVDVVTDAAGRYLVTVPNGGVDYFVTVCTALTNSGPFAGCAPIPASLDQNTTSFVTVDDPNGQNPNDFRITAGQDRLDADFGFNGGGGPPLGGLASIGDTVFLDRDGNGTQDGIDPGIEGVTLALVVDSNNNGVADPGEPAVSTTTTDLNGNYDFQGAQPGTDYVVVVTDLNDVLLYLNESTPPTAGDVPVLVANQDYNDADFGFAPRDRGTIGNQFWRDISGGTLGLFEAGEPGIASVSLKLWVDNNGNGGAPEPGIDNCVRGCVDLLLTDQNGQYEFRGLPFDDYIVEVTDELGVLVGLQSSVCAPADCPDPSADNVSKTPPYATTLTSGAPLDFAADFGYIPAPLTGSFTLTGLVYFDAQPNGDHSVDTPLQDFAVDDVEVSLFIDLDFDGVGDVLYATQITSSTPDATVNYTFTDLPPASWVVQVNGPGTEIEGADQTEPTTSPGSPANTQPAFTCSNTASQTTCNGSGQNETEVDFGFNKPPTLVLISDVRSYRADRSGQTVFEFQTRSELGANGFFVWRRDQGTGEFVQVNASVVAADRSPRGATYRVLDSGAPEGVNEYVIYETEQGGGERAYGPFRVSVDELGGPQLDGESSVQARPVELRELRRLAGARAEQAAARFVAATIDSEFGTAQAAGPVGGLQDASDEATFLVPARIQVRETGMQFVSRADLAAAMASDEVRVERWLRNGQLRVTRGDRQVSWLPAADLSGLVFHGEASDDPTSAFAAYRVRRGTGRTMATVAGGSPTPVSGASFTSTARFEEQLFAGTVVAQDPTADFWFWRALSAGHPTNGVFETTVDVPGAVGAGEIRLVLFGASGDLAAVDHEVEVEVNGQLVGVFEWAGLGSREFSMTIPNGVLNDGANQVTVTALLPSGVPFSFVYVDAIELDYEREFVAAGDRLEFRAENGGPVSLDGFSSAPTVIALGSGLAPRLVATAVDSGIAGTRASFQTTAGERYVAWVPGTETAAVTDSWIDWTMPNDGAEYLVITPRQLRAAADRLAEHRQDAGLSTIVVEVEALQAEYTQGNATPTAVQTFLERAWTRWQERPRFVVLLGGGSFDYRDHLGLGGNLIAPLLVATGEGLYSSDLAFADVEGGDGRPEFAVGRIPALTAAEAHAYVDKLIGHELPGERAGSRRMLLANDNQDSAGNFAASSEALREIVGRGVSTWSLSLDDTDAATARQLLHDQLDLGAYWLSFVGHGSIDRFAAEALLTTFDVPTLDNGAGLPIVSALTCTVGRFEIPGFASLAEELVLAEDRGAIAVISPSGTSLNGLAEELGKELFRAVFSGDHQLLGDALVEAMNEYSGPTRPLLVYQLLGDPAVDLR